MILSLEAKALKAAGGKDALEQLFRALDPKILKFLLALEHPMEPRFNAGKPDATSAAITDGRREVVALLYRYGSNSPHLPATSNQ